LKTKHQATKESAINNFASAEKFGDKPSEERLRQKLDGEIESVFEVLQSYVQFDEIISKKK
jgi:hypothetical protein